MSNDKIFTAENDDREKDGTVIMKPQDDLGAKKIFTADNDDREEEGTVIMKPENNVGTEKIFTAENDNSDIDTNENDDDIDNGNDESKEPKVIIVPGIINGGAAKPF